jgi:hypothetical protein
MAAGLALAAADVTGPDGTVYPAVQVVIRANRMTLTPRGKGAVAAVFDGVTGVVRLSPLEWSVTSGAGVFGVSRKRGCGCGSR